MHLTAELCDIDGVCFGKNDSLFISALSDVSQLLEMGEAPRIYPFI